jgi:hypothetical protein
VGSCRRELLDHIIALKEPHLRRLLSEFVSYYHDDRTHLGLSKKRLAAESAQRRPDEWSPIHDWAVCTIATSGAA